MGRDEHRHSKGNNYLAQTPKNMKADEMDVEFADVFADVNDRIAYRRYHQAQQRVKGR